MDLRTRHHRRGLSLIEVLVALALLTVMTAMSAQAIFNATEIKDLLAERDESTRAARVTMGRLRRELQLSFFQTPSDASANTYQTVFVGHDENPDRLYFASLSHHRLYRNSRESDQTEITVWAEPARGPDAKGYVLYHRESPRIDEEPDEGGVIYPLAYNVRNFNLRYLDPQTNEWVDEWDTRSGETTNRLPRAVQIGLVLIGTDPEDERRTIDLPFMTTALIESAERVRRDVGSSQ